jgi:hypothetical protein
MKITGHRSEAIYRRYAIVSETDLAEAIGKLERHRLESQNEGAPVKPPALIAGIEIPAKMM